MKKTASTFILFLLFASLFAQKPYRGAEVFSKDKVLYGKFEMRMKMIKGSGMLSTFYTIKQDGDYWAELDIEVLGKNNAQIMSTNIITDGASGDLVHSTEEIHLDYSLADDFHTYTLEWTPNYIAWFIDGVEQRRETGDVVSHLNATQGYRFNSWISCSPAWVGAIDRDALPQYQYVDWIEYYSYNASTEDFTKEWRDDFDSFNTARWSKAEWTFYCNEVDFVKENAFIEAGKLVLAITDPDPVVIHEAPLVTEMADISLLVDGPDEVIILSSVFSSEETLSYEVSGASHSSATIVDGVLTISPLTEGTDILTITATTPFDMSASDEVNVTVGPSGADTIVTHEAPIVTEMADISLIVDGPAEVITLSNVFASEDTLSYEVSGASHSSATIADGVLTIAPLTEGTDLLTITATTPFDMSASDEVSVMVGPSGTELNSIMNFTVAPNPSMGQFSIQLADDYSLETEVTIFNITGQMLHRQMLSSSFSDIDVSELNAGMYILQISNLKGKNLKKIIIE